MNTIWTKLFGNRAKSHGKAGARRGRQACLELEKLDERIVPFSPWMVVNVGGKVWIQGSNLNDWATVQAGPEQVKVVLKGTFGD